MLIVLFQNFALQLSSVTTQRPRPETPQVTLLVLIGFKSMGNKRIEVTWEKGKNERNPILHSPPKIIGSL